MKSIIRKVSSNYHLPYFTLTPTFSVCPTHGYLNGEQPRCSHCDRETEVYSRVVGYLRPIKQWNDGKQAEYCRRQPFRIPPEDLPGVAAITLKDAAPVSSPARALPEGAPVASAVDAEAHLRQQSGSV